MTWLAKTAFVTGAASGIGLGIAGALAQAGAKVMLCDIEEAALAKAVEGLKRTNADVDGVKADVSLKAELKAAAEATIARYGKVHILVNNAGVGGGGLTARGPTPDGTGRSASISWRSSGESRSSARYRTAWRGRTHRLHGLHRRTDLPGSSNPYNVIQIWRGRAFGGPADRARSARHRRVGAVPGFHPHPDHGLAAQPAGTLRATLRGQTGAVRSSDMIQDGLKTRVVTWHRSALCRRACPRRH